MTVKHWGLTLRTGPSVQPMGSLRKISHSLKVKREPFHLDVIYMWSHMSKDQDKSLWNYASALWSLAFYNSHHKSSLSTTLIALVSALGIGCMLTSLTPKGPIESISNCSVEAGAAPSLFLECSEQYSESKGNDNMLWCQETDTISAKHWKMEFL